MNELIDQLPQPFMMVGDMNAHNPMWRDSRLDTRGRMIERIMAHNNLVCLNIEGPTYYRPSDQSSSTIDLTLISSNIALEYRWMRNKEQHGSDHYPIHITKYIQREEQPEEKWKLQEVNWEKYGEIASIGHFWSILEEQVEIKQKQGIFRAN